MILGGTFDDKRARKLTHGTKNRLLLKAKGKCEHCGNEITAKSIPHEIHHITPFKKRGSDKESNLIVLCPNCHRQATADLISPEQLKMDIVYRVELNGKAVRNKKELVSSSEIVGQDENKKPTTGPAIEALTKKVEQWVTGGKEYTRVYRNKKIGKDVFHVLGEAFVLFRNPKYLLVECNNQATVTADDVIRFGRKLNSFSREHQSDTIHALLAYTGELPKEARDATRHFQPTIKFKKFP